MGLPGHPRPRGHIPCPVVPAAPRHFPPSSVRTRHAVGLLALAPPHTGRACPPALPRDQLKGLPVSQFSHRCSLRFRGTSPPYFSARSAPSSVSAILFRTSSQLRHPPLHSFSHGCSPVVQPWTPSIGLRPGSAHPASRRASASEAPAAVAKGGEGGGRRGGRASTSLVLEGKQSGEEGASASLLSLDDVPLLDVLALTEGAGAGAGAGPSVAAAAARESVEEWGGGGGVGWDEFCSTMEHAEPSPSAAAEGDADFPCDFPAALSWEAAVEGTGPLPEVSQAVMLESLRGALPRDLTRPYSHSSSSSSSSSRSSSRNSVSSLPAPSQGLAWQSEPHTLPATLVIPKLSSRRKGVALSGSVTESAREQEAAAWLRDSPAAGEGEGAGAWAGAGVGKAASLLAQSLAQKDLRVEELVEEVLRQDKSQVQWPPLGLSSPPVSGSLGIHSGEGMARGSSSEEDMFVGGAWLRPARRGRRRPLTAQEQEKMTAGKRKVRGQLSKLAKERFADPEFKAKMMEAMRKGYVEKNAPAKISRAHVLHNANPEARRRKSEILKGRPFFCKACGGQGHRRNFCPDLGFRPKTATTKGKTGEGTEETPLSAVTALGMESGNPSVHERPLSEPLPHEIKPDGVGLGKPRRARKKLCVSGEAEASAAGGEGLTGGVEERVVNPFLMSDSHVLQKGASS